VIHLLPLARLRPPAQVEAGQAVYTPVVLAVYDQFALGFSSRFAWRCPKTEMLALYDRHVGRKHLDNRRRHGLLSRQMPLAGRAAAVDIAGRLAAKRSSREAPAECSSGIRSSGAGTSAFSHAAFAPVAGRDLTPSEWREFLPGEPYRRTCP
jgi:hypothetical protein